MSARTWVFTLNNPEEEDETLLEDAVGRKVRYICWGAEIAETGTPHLQGYMELHNVSRISGFKKMAAPFQKMHLELRKGSRDQAREYCMKGNQSHEEWALQGSKGPNWGKHAHFKEFGDWSAGGAGARTDLDKTRTLALEEGMAAVTTCSTLQAIQLAEKFLTYNEEPRDWKPEVIWICGPTGAGKSKLARILTSDHRTYVKNTSAKWWNGYDKHNAIIVDDFRDSWWPLTFMLALLDRYELQVEVKGGYRQIQARLIIVTSIRHPSTMYQGTGEDIRQLERRLSKVTILPEGLP